MAVSEGYGRVPPHNQEAEMATLGAMLIAPDADTLTTVLKYLREDDFYRSAHRRIFNGILTLSNRNESIDLITLTSALRASGDLDAAGGAAYISQLTSLVPSSANVEYYARIVAEASLRRRLIKLANDITARSFDDTGESRQIVEEAQKRIFELTTDRQTGSFVRAGEVIGETIKAIEKLYHTQDSFTGIPSGFSDLDNMLSGFQKSEFIVVGARPSVGKTAFALSIAANVAIRHNRPVAFFTLEMSCMSLMQRLVSSEARISLQAIRKGMIRPADFNSLANAAGLIYEAPLYITDTPGMRLLDLRATARRLKAQHDISVMFVDYLTLVTSENPDLPRHEQIAEISRSFKALARELDIPVIALSQVRRETEGKTPTLADIRESGSIEQDADVVMFLHRERGTERSVDEAINNVETQLIVAKQRNGPVGSIRIAFIPQYTRFESMIENVRA